MIAAVDRILLRDEERPWLEGLRRFVVEFLYFGAKEARACLFAGLFFAAVFFVADFFAAVFFEAVFVAPVFVAPVFFAALPAVLRALLGPASRRSASSSAARSDVISSSRSPRRTSPAR